MKKIIILNGPNLNLLGEREKNQYGDLSLKDIEKNCEVHAKKIDIDVSFYQSNIEGEIVEKIQNSRKEYDGLIINAGGYTHTSVAIADAVAAIETPVVEVHISNVYSREDYRHHSLMAKNCIGVIAGFGMQSYKMAIDFLNQ